jgi:uncharacterized protein (TIGR02466 family)
MELIEQFTTNIYGSILQNVDVSLTDNIIKFKNANPSVSKSNEGGWQSQVLNWNALDWLTPLMIQIKQEVEPLYSEYGAINASSFKYWINVNEPTHSNVRHRHVGSLFSGVMYIKVPKNSGNIIFHRDNLHIAFFHAITKKNRPVIELTPQENGLLIFPAFLEHEVTPNLSNETRISIAFNIN